MYRLDDLLYLMSRLRDPQYGCPWDLEQRYATIVPHTLEEAYEVADAIEREDFDHLRDELGDLLFQVVYYCQLATEERRFAFNDVVDAITRKLVRRHPHVFHQGNLYAPPEAVQQNEDEIKQRWEDIKAQERADKAKTPQQLSLLDDVPRALPALTRAAKLQKRASRVGFDWRQADAVLDKLHEEIRELQVAMDDQEASSITEEVGDLLFTVVNLARHLHVDAENALRLANHKFETRFQFMERSLQATGQSLEAVGLEQLDRLWEQAKQQEKN